MNKFGFPNIGFGLGLRSKHFKHIIENKPDIDWFEIISENYMDSAGKPRETLDKIRADYPIAMHGVSLSIGSADELNKDYLKNLKALADDINPVWISDHLCWTGINKKNSHDLLPVPLTEEALNHIIPRIKQVQDFLGRNILLENPSSYLTYKADSIPEYEFMARMAEAADCALLLDVNNIFVACFNHRLDPKKYIDAIPMERVVQIHLAGHLNKETHIVDTHDAAVIDEVWDLYKYALGKAGHDISTMIEWDAKIPEFEVLEAELNKARTFSKEPFAEIPPRDEFKFDGQGNSNHSMLNLQNNLQDTILDGDIKSHAPETWVVEKPGFPASEQVQVYVKGYRIRLFKMIMADYEVTAHYLGKEKMEKTVREYIATTPSEFYDAGKFSEQFADWLSAQKIDKFAAELAELERDISIRYNLALSAPLLQEDLANLTPDDFMDMKLELLISATLKKFRHDVNSYYTEFYHGEDKPEKPPKTAGEFFLMIYRNEKNVYRLNLEKPEYQLLEIIQQTENIGEAMEKLSEISDLNEDELSAKIQQYFAKWLEHSILKAA
ncbi:MAG: DUF2063 domain-containing protein [Alphaproteobacteria bacterium CG11_big_fil_rev_8_21_14_0_20_44_7]|nr:MAG: DUF2063 domain-containing protein [Alphaproteobacteria bacterium CG11_big_fil_rev_8_21_14_0_20_44_7]